MSYGDHIEPDYVAPADVFLPDRIYGQVLDSVVIACTDVVLFHRGRILMGLRAWDPMPDWWIIGGRMRPGESAAESAERNVYRETDVEIDPARFRYLATCNSVYARRKQKPAHHGSHTLAVVMTVTLYDHEASAITLNEEYRGPHRWTDPVDLLHSPHGVLRQVAERIMGTVA